MDVRSVHPELVRNLMESSRPEAEERLRRSLALTALAESEKLSVDDTELNTKLKEVKGQLSGERNIDPERLRQAVLDDLLQEKLLGWLEETAQSPKKRQNPKQRNPKTASHQPPKKAPAKPRPTRQKRQSQVKTPILIGAHDTNRTARQSPRDRRPYFPSHSGRWRGTQPMSVHPQAAPGVLPSG